MKWHPAALADNAMLYKDVTQWIRRRAFATLFFGLLAAAELIAVFASLMTVGDASTHVSGPLAFSLLTALLGYYTLTVAFLGYTATDKEFQGRTFELYEVAGMSLEKMIGGKLLSLVVQFGFGFCCIMPFLFFAFLLGGVDFYAIVAAIALVAIAVPPLCLVALFAAFYGRTWPGLSWLIRIGMLLLAVLLVPVLFELVNSAFRSYGNSLLDESVKFIKDLLSLDTGTLLATGLLGWIYVHLCLLLFYLCCNAIAPVTDTREREIKLLTFTLSFSVMLFSLYVFHGYGSDDVLPLVLLPCILMCLLGLVCFHGRLEVPLMIRKLPPTRWMTVRLYRWFFEPGPRGAMRTLALFWGAALAYTLLVPPTFSLIFDALHARDNQMVGKLFAGAMLAVPFFVVFPGCLFVKTRTYRSHPRAMPLRILLWWAIGGFLMTAVFGALFHEPTTHDSPQYFLLTLIAQSLSPVSALLSIVWSEELAGLLGPMFWLVLGMLGFYLMRHTLRARVRLARLMADERPATSKPDAVEPVHPNPLDDEMASALDEY